MQPVTRRMHKPFIQGLQATLNVAHRVAQLGLWVTVWTIDDESDRRSRVEVGVGGIMTDRSDRLSQVLAKVA